MKIIAKILKLSILIFLILIIFNFVPAFFYKKEINTNPLPENYLKGVFHVHSLYSDGLGSVEDITNAAENSGLDFVILTDHGVPNINCVKSTKFYNNVLLIGGSEFSLDAGHMSSAGFKLRNYKFPLEPQETIDEVNSDNGFTFTAHPFDGRIPWTDWNIKNFTGIEILNSYSCAKKIGFLGLFSFPLEYLVNKEYSLLETLYYPEKNILKWDEFNRKGRYMGIFALDAHSKLPITKKIVLKFPSYSTMFKIFNIYVKTTVPVSTDPKLASLQIVRSIKSGHFFNVIEALSSANGFETYFKSDDNRKINTGDRSNAYIGNIHILLPFKFRTDILIRRDGKIIKRIKKNIKNELKIRINNPGVYRSEIFISDSSYNKLPWIITNPFFLGDSIEKITENSIEKSSNPLSFNSSDLHIEKNNSSEGIYTFHATGNIHQIDYLLKSNKKSKNFWVSLALRQKINLSGSGSISFNTRSDKNMRFWLELRTGKGENELWFRHSFLAKPYWTNTKLYFSDFHCINRKNFSKSINLSDITSIFISINNSIVFKPGISGFLQLKNFNLNK